MIFLLSVFGLFGLAVGSFVNTAATRLLQDKRLSGRSRCPSCARVLRWFELIPLLSFLWQRAICRSCRAPIALRYPLGELAAGGLFAVTAWRFLLFPEAWSSFQDGILTRRDILVGLDLVLWLSYLAILLIFFQTDLAQKILPDRLMFPAIALALVGSAFEHTLLPWDGGLHWLGPFGMLGGFLSATWSGRLISAATLSLFFFVISFVSRGRWMGWGDGKLAFLIGMMFGFPGALVAIALGFLLGGAFSASLLALGRASRKSQIPLGPFLISGGFAAIVLGPEILRWYFSLFPQ